MTAYLNAMRAYARFRGRASRSDFWLFTLVLFVISVVAALIDQGLGTATDRSGLVLGVVQLVHLLPVLAISVRRLHDLDRTGWWLLIALTGLGSIVLLVFDCLPGTSGPNRFGPDPRAGAVAPTAGYGSPTPASPAAPAPANRDVVDEIGRLAALRAGGSLSDAEFEALKAQLLARPRGA